MKDEVAAFIPKEPSLWSQINKPVFFVFCLFLIIIPATTVYLYAKQRNIPVSSVWNNLPEHSLQTRILPTTDDDLLVCPQDVKACNDGTMVSRVGRNCEFDFCPEEQPIE